MTEVLGIKRLGILGALIIVNMILVSVVYFQLEPSSVQSGYELKKVERRLEDTRRNIAQMQLDYGQFSSVIGDFKALKDKGFLSAPRRWEAEKLLSVLQENTGVVRARARIQGVKREDSLLLRKAGYALIKTPITITLESYDDLDVFDYITQFEAAFPGYVQIEDVKITRDREVSRSVLEEISRGADTVLVEAALNMAWYTIIPEDKAARLEGE